MDKGIVQGDRLLSRSIPQHSYCSSRQQPPAPTGSRNLVTHTESIIHLDKTRKKEKSSPSVLYCGESVVRREAKRSISSMTYPEDDQLYRRTQLLFKKRREARHKALRKKADNCEKPKPTSPSEFVAPLHPPSQTLGKYISRYTPYYYQPPKQPLPEDRPRSSKASKSRSKSQEPARRTSISSLPLREPVPYPPPPDSNYSKVNSRLPLQRTLDFDSPEHHIPVDTSIPVRKFVDCEKCGKKNFSSSTQLAIHQESKKCKNRQDRNTVHKCKTCFRIFDTKHNLQKHICRLR